MQTTEMIPPRCHICIRTPNPCQKSNPCSNTTKTLTDSPTAKTTTISHSPRGSPRTRFVALIFLYSFSINRCSPRGTLPPPRDNTSRHSRHSPPSRIHTFLPPMRNVALECVFKTSHRSTLRSKSVWPSMDCAHGCTTVTKSVTPALDAQCSVYERELPIWSASRFRQVMNGRILFGWYFWKLIY